MIRKMFLFASAIFFIFATGMQAQKAVITFENKKHDFGQINEDGGHATTVFEFTNTGDAPLIIQRVSASCGCTTPDWTKTPIEPGEKGTVSASYNPIGRPGAFSKDVYVYSNASNEMERLTITGNVTPKASSTKTSNTSNNFPIFIGSLGLNSKNVQLGNVVKGTSQTRDISIRNNSNSPLAVSLTNVPSYLDVKVTPAKLQPNQEGVISFNLDSKKNTEWGPLQDDVFIVLNGNKETTDNFKINITGNIVEDFSKMNVFLLY